MRTSRKPPALARALAQFLGHPLDPEPRQPGDQSWLDRNLPEDPSYKEHPK